MSCIGNLHPPNDIRRNNNYCIGQMRKSIRAILPLIDVLLAPFVYPAGLVLKSVRRLGVHRVPICRDVLMKLGVFPIRDHYYEPMFNAKHLSRPLSSDRELPGINWNVEEQLDNLKRLCYSHELSTIPTAATGSIEFHFNNDAFESGDAEYWYNLVRAIKPKKIIEVGSGFSTLIARRALAKNKEEDPKYQCKHVCIEPFEQAWLDDIGVQVLRKKVEDVGKETFLDLDENDILFIDSSHVIRPQGDVLYEYLEVLPILTAGVIVHLHDIFSPKDYLEEWIVDRVKFWNEQYLLEAFLTSNKEWRIIGALNFLHHNHYGALSKVCPYLTPHKEPGSFYIQKNV